MRLNVLIMLGSEGPGAAERWVAGGRRAAARDAVRLVSQAPCLGRIIVGTSETNFMSEAAGLGVEWDIDPPGKAFHFGERLAGLMARYPADVYLYLGAGSLPLLPAETLTAVITEVGQATAPTAVTNNLHSSDWMVLNCPAAVAARVQRLATDNALGWVLRTETGVAVRSLPPSAGTRLDIDTPADLLLLALHPHSGPALEHYLRAQPRDTNQWLAAGRRLFTPGGQVALIGRISSGVWSHIEANSQAWIRVFSEERGMSASGRLAAGHVKSLLAAQLVQLGPAGFFRELSQMVEAVFFDTRVVMAHVGRWPSAADRYAADLGLPDQIADGWLKEFTQAALEAPMPVVLGGHGVVAGDLYGLVEIALAGGLAGATVYNKT
jgi:CTP:molybdopterin cytidylyltransferase MocA